MPRNPSASRSTCDRNRGYRVAWNTNFVMNDEKPDAQPGLPGDVIRLLIGSALTVLLFSGGIYWLYSLRSGAPHRDSGTSVQVRLLTTEEPTPIPVTAQSSEQPTTPSDSDGVSDRDDAWIHDKSIVVAPSGLRKSKTAVSQIQRLTPEADSKNATQFQQALLQHIAHFRRYPPEALSRGMQGTVTVLFLMRRDGSIIDAWIQSSSGESVLDSEAIATIHRAEPLPRIPTELPDQIRIMLPVEFGAQ